MSARYFAKRHYVFIASVIADLTLPDAARAYVARMFANRLALDNPSFDRDRFMAAALDRKET